jgi:hypothetical protein
MCIYIESTSLLAWRQEVMDTYKGMYMSVCVCVFVFMNIYICPNIYIYIYVYICVYMCIYIESTSLLAWRQEVMDTYKGMYTYNNNNY